ncbi:MAG: N-(5'-phosphoribosyl)anthranilate isomerase [Bacteroidetes bacterium HGW-Bacteroidetes-4]|jgi:phosphoribosylanthranilate isomerase|nr:MAG: N-(5'-phosphoribosyl)anthranilate isomerase [Bacteroidetes bacterium HGW-Bacteroidetes-4]
MSVPLKIKVCGLVEPQNIIAVDQLGPDYLGYIFYPQSPRHMDKNPANLPETKARKVGVFVDADFDAMVKKARYFKLQTIQLHGNETPETCIKLKALGFEVFKAFAINEASTQSLIAPYNDACDLFLFDAKTELKGGSGKKFNWNKLNELAAIGPFLLSGGIGPNDAQAIKQLNLTNLMGIDINSRFEVEPGIKVPALIEKFIKQLNSD